MEFRADEIVWPKLYRLMYWTNEKRQHPAERSEHMHKIISDVDGQPRKYTHIRYIVQTIREREKKSLSTTVSRRAHLKIFMLKLKQFSAHFYICFFGRLDALFSTCAQQWWYYSEKIVAFYCFLSHSFAATEWCCAREDFNSGFKCAQQ